MEMNETAHILRSATAKSLVIMDEIGRGTSTRDGLAIAWAVSTYILSRIGARTLFATHFHELTGIAHERVANLSMEVLDRGGEIVFLKRVREGPSSNSYGIHVARLAGLPAETLALAEKMLSELNAGSGVAAAAPAPIEKAPVTQKELFSLEELVIQEIRALHPENTTPLEALSAITRWRKELSGSGGG